MKTTLLFCLLFSGPVLAQLSSQQRFELEAGISALHLPTPYRSGWHLRQQLTAYIRPRLGIALGIGGGVSANNDPLMTQDPASPSSSQPNPTQLSAFYKRQEYMTDFSVVALPLLTKRHQVKVQAGLSVYRRHEIGVDSIVRENPKNPAYFVVGKIINTRRVVPMAALSYDYRLSSRWAVGVNGTAYFTGSGQPTTTLGLRGTYRFGLSADSLGMKPLPWNDLRAGVRLGASLVGQNSMGPGGRYRTRFVGGLWAELPLSLTWAVRAELNYAQRGYRSVGVSTGNMRYLSNYANLNFLEIPFLFRHEVAYRWHLYTGPYLAFFLNGYTETEGNRNPPIRPSTSSGLLLGTSYKITDRLAANLRYQRDLVQISSTPYGGFHSFQLTAGWAFK
ncbi:porin family protein [Spirosoma fluviale]|uniref:Outer membrane protein beta-barrel domain-containing protein n=1 Tax=Spirosoma fluviale TaxID=1597977 RepID=A0A286GK42_9BACT|nr:porin family protein [Spirosoma fluviale]SOD95907.1 Outer membrane protein beta-barrel domain-containing protein [Spirosoma fluviale]